MSMYHNIREDVPFVRVDAEGHIVGTANFKGNFSSYLAAIQNGTIAVAPNEIATHSQGTAAGSLSGAENYDLISISLTAGVTYSFAYRGTPIDGVEDPFLALFGPDFGFVTEDDDGGAGRSSLITITPTSSGTYYLYATSWYTLAYGDPSIDTGNYTIDVWTANPAHDAVGTIAGSEEVALGTTFGHLDVAGDVDVYQVTMTEGMVYSFTYAGGIWGSDDWEDPTTPGENIGIIELLDSAGNVVASNINYESGLSFFADEDATYYVRVSGLEATMTGGYTLDVSEVNPADYDPLESIDWENAATVPFEDVGGVPTAYVYFGAAGENFGETADDGVSPMVTFGWQPHEIDAVMLALEQYEHILGVNYEITTDIDQATFRLSTTSSELYGAYFYPQDPGYGTQQGIGVFNVDSGGWAAFPQSLQQGGFAFGVILHEFGHAHGLAHPHDTGGGSEIMLGVASSASYGVYDLNQGVYTVMSYNDAWDFHPDGPSSFSIAGIDNGWSGTLSAFDIAQLQLRYGVHDYNTGNNVYALTDVVDDAFYQTIWDSAGIDTISYGGLLHARIDLTAATLDYTPTGGGVVSFLLNDPATTPASAEVKGGYTIAGGVVIENATGGSGNDVLIGNSAANVLTGNDGNDILMGRLGDDQLNGGVGSDTAAYNDAVGSVTVNLAAQSANGADGTDVLTSIENATGSEHDDILLGDGNANVLDGGDGDDLIDGAGEADTASYASVSGGVTVDLRIQGTAQNTIGGGTDTLVSIENLTGSMFNDRLIGDNNENAIKGGNGLDVVSLGGGNDRFVAEIGASKVGLKSGTMSVDIITDFDQGGDDLIDVSGLGQAFTFRGTSANRNDGDLTYKTYNSVNGAENALGFDIDGQPGASGVSGPVTVVYGNVDGGDADFAIVLLNTSSVSADDFMFGSPSAAALLAGGSSSTQGDFGGLSESKFMPLSSRYDHYDLV